MSQKRLLGLVAAVAIIVAACGGSTATSAPETGAPGASPAGSPGAAPSAGGNLAAEQILNVDIAGEPPTLDPNKAQDSNSLTVLRALHRPLVYINESLEVVPALAESGRSPRTLRR
jgi:ABC-type transport system substrate-binding protein